MGHYSEVMVEVYIGVMFTIGQGELVKSLSVTFTWILYTLVYTNLNGTIGIIYNFKRIIAVRKSVQTV